jgi:hypothetical protein
MELIPVLSTIILIATISTFLLAIGAYILYKVREGKGQKAAAPIPSTVNAELFTPTEAQVQFPHQGPGIGPQQGYAAPQTTSAFQKRNEQPLQQKAGPHNAPIPKQNEESEPKFLKYTSEGYVVPSKEVKNPGTLKWK